MFISGMRLWPPASSDVSSPRSRQDGQRLLEGPRCDVLENARLHVSPFAPVWDHRRGQTLSLVLQRCQGFLVSGVTAANGAAARAWHRPVLTFCHTEHTIGASLRLCWSQRDLSPVAASPDTR